LAELSAQPLTDTVAIDMFIVPTGILYTLIVLGSEIDGQRHQMARRSSTGISRRTSLVSSGADEAALLHAL
jgi:hypothetical protein